MTVPQHCLYVTTNAYLLSKLRHWRSS